MSFVVVSSLRDQCYWGGNAGFCRWISITNSSIEPVLFDSLEDFENSYIFNNSTVPIQIMTIDEFDVVRMMAV